jgi:hypothetical protein
MSLIDDFMSSIRFYELLYLLVLDLWHRFIGIIIPYGSRNNRALLVYLHSIEHFILPNQMFLPFQICDASWTSFLM